MIDQHLRLSRDWRAGCHRFDLLEQRALPSSELFACPIGSGPIGLGQTPRLPTHNDRWQADHRVIARGSGRRRLPRSFDNRCAGCARLALTASASCRIQAHAPMCAPYRDRSEGWTLHLAPTQTPRRCRRGVGV
ncbi:hypothetical protein XCV0195 [Xanthomonas euvesicatoria pv. vesicatoria str. 85-10]|uniref:Uncharacterized protein n=1 Tax=Xanthomonas euvesicatoria pv. vesicatoria (strain 85-10) TaxID=316273 RepID=Q3BZ87_XANE5|nr:hypothetical protein XCV0195 [Xanthomonas euvesicatoria pv. vesicatoria str. 85-10]